MAARRLVVVMLVLLLLSTLAAAFLPIPDKKQATPVHKRKHQANAGGRAPPPTHTGLLLVSRMRISNRRPKTVRIERGDELRLEVAAPFGDDVEIPALGLTAAVTPFAPAQFDLLATEIGTFPVRTVDSGRLAGRILVGKQGDRALRSLYPGNSSGTRFNSIVLPSR